MIARETARAGHTLGPALGQPPRPDGHGGRARLDELRQTVRAAVTPTQGPLGSVHHQRVEPQRLQRDHHPVQRLVLMLDKRVGHHRNEADGAHGEEAAHLRRPDRPAVPGGSRWKGHRVLRCGLGRAAQRPGHGQPRTAGDVQEGRCIRGGRNRRLDGRCRLGRGRGGPGEDQVDVAGVQAPGLGSAAAQRPVHQRLGAEAVPVLGNTLAVPRSPPPSDAGGSARRAPGRNFTASSSLDRDDAAPGWRVGIEHILDGLALLRGVHHQQPLDAAVRSMSSRSRVRASRCAMPAVSISTIFLPDSRSSRSSSAARSCAVCTGTPRMRP